MIYKKWDIVLVDLNPTKGSEISKIRPCLVVSPNSVNTYMNTIVVVPFTSKPKGYPFRILTNHKNIEGPQETKNRCAIVMVSTRC